MYSTESNDTVNVWSKLAIRTDVETGQIPPVLDLKSKEKKRI